MAHTPRLTSLLFLMIIPYLLQLILLLHISAASTAGTHHLEHGHCDATDNDPTCTDSTDVPNTNIYGTNKFLTPSDLSPPRLFTDWTNTTTSVPGTMDQIVATGSILQQAHTEQNSMSHFAVLPHVISHTTVSQLLSLLRYGDASIPEYGKSPTSYHGQTSVPLDTDPDSVDGMTSQEIFIDNDNLRAGLGSKTGGTMSDEGEARVTLRKKIRVLLDPVLEEIVTPFVRERYTEQCGKGKGRECTPCYSLIRRYRAGERVSHAPHHDKHSLVTVVVSLSDYGREYTGGLYVASSKSQRFYIGLNRGDAVVHQGDLYHGVQVHDHEPTNTTVPERSPERWSWILWYRDSFTCEDHSSEWFRSCAMEDHNPTCQLLLATAVTNQEDILYWNEKACDNGHAAACVKVARAHLKTLPSPLPLNPKMAKSLFERAVTLAEEPDGHYGLAGMYLHYANTQGSSIKPNDPLIVVALRHLQSAALGGHAFAMFNLGMAHLFGYGYTNRGRNSTLASEWFATCGLPEGLEAKAMYLDSAGRKEEAKVYHKSASVLGYGTYWRKQARRATGSGGAGGVDLNLEWPSLPNNIRPPEW